MGNCLLVAMADSTLFSRFRSTFEVRNKEIPTEDWFQCRCAPLWNLVTVVNLSVGQARFVNLVSPTYKCSSLGRHPAAHK
jgi:hypothetical protein